MIIMGLIGVWFYRMAKENDLNKVLWVIIGIASYFGGQVITVVILSFSSPELVLEEGIALTGYSIFGGIVGTLVAWAIIQNVINNKKKQKTVINDDLIDDNATFYSQKESDF